MKNVFNFSRFGKYIAYDLRRIRSSYGLTFLILALMPAVIYLISVVFGILNGKGWSVPSTQLRLAVFFLTTGALLLSYPASCYGFVTEKKSGSSWLMLPASSFEKFLSMFVITMVVLPVAYSVLYFGSDALLSLTGHGYGPNLMSCIFREEGGVKMVSLDGNGVGTGAYPLYLAFETTALTYLLGAVIFRKNKVVKTILCLLVFSLIFMMVATFIFSHFDMEWWKSSLLKLLGDNEDTVILRVKVLANVFSWAVIALLGLGTFFRIKTLKH